MNPVAREVQLSQAACKGSFKHHAQLAKVIFQETLDLTAEVSLELFRKKQNKKGLRVQGSPLRRHYFIRTWGDAR